MFFDKEMSTEQTVNWILKVAVSVLAAVIGIVVVALVIGLFVSNDIVDNTKVFEMIGPAFNTVIGAFVGLLGGLSIGNGGSVTLNQPPPSAKVEPHVSPAPVAPLTPPSVVVPPAPPVAKTVPVIYDVVAPASVAPAVATVSTPVVNTVAPVASAEVVAGFGGKLAPVQPDHPEI